MAPSGADSDDTDSVHVVRLQTLSVGRVVVARDGAADAPDERGVPPHEQLKRGPVTLVREPGRRRYQHGPELTNHADRVRVGHRVVAV